MDEAGFMPGTADGFKRDSMRNKTVTCMGINASVPFLMQFSVSKPGEPIF
jgi:hypothetical protein